MYTINRPSKIKSIYAELPVTTAAGTTGAALVIDTSGIYPCRVFAPSASIYVSPLTTAPLSDTGIKIASSGYFDLLSQNGYIALYSTSTGGTYQMTVYKD